MEIEEKSRLFIDILSGIAISILIIFIIFYLPFLGLFMALILPMPILYFRLKLGRNSGVVIMLTVFAVVFITTLLLSDSTSGSPEIVGNLKQVPNRFYISIDMLFYGSLLLTGFFLGECLELKISIEKVFIYTIISTLGICFLAFFIYSLSTGHEIASIVSDYISDNIKLTIALYENMGMSQDSVDIISNSIEVIEYALIRMLPSLIPTLFVFVVWVNTLFIKKILTKKGINLPELQNLKLWKASDHLVWVVIFLGLLMIIPGKSIKITAFNCIIILMSVYFFQGVAIISFIFERKNFPPLLRVSIYIIIAIQQIFILAIIGLGFFDTWMNFRKIGILNDSDSQ